MLSNKVHIFRALVWVGLFLLAAFSPVWGILPSKQPKPSDFDKRQTAPRKSLADEKKAAAKNLKENSKGVEVDWDPVLESPRWIRNKDGFLTGHNGEGVGVTKDFANQVPLDDPDRGLKAFLNEHRPLFGHDASVLKTARKNREFVTPHNGMRTVVFQQEFENVPIFQALLVSHTTKNGELLSISSQLLADPLAASRRGMPNRAAVKPISAEKAITLAGEGLGANIKESDIRASNAQPGPDNSEKGFSSPGLKGETRTKLVWLPTGPDTMRLCWEVLLNVQKQAETFRVLIDTETGEAWLRQCLTHNISPATYRVFTGDSPTPYSPAHPVPSSVQPPLVARSVVVTNAVNTTASPAGWIKDGDNETRGNNVQAHLDRNDDNVPDLPRPQGSPFRVFDFPLDLTQSPAASGNAAVVQLFYWCNWMHDKLYELGFTEAAGNFQGTNFGRGGFGNDPVLADAQDGGDVNNANMTTFPDGASPRLQVYLFTGPEPDRDGALDAEIILHEYTHGLSNRRVGGGVGITASQSMGLGEGWSDFYALSLLSEPGDNVDGNYPIGGYLTHQLSGMTQNYYFGIRRYPYTTDISKNPLTFKDIDPSQATGHPGVPVSPVYGSSSASQIHAQGEVWCSALWEARANLIRKLGHVRGNQLTLQLVTDGLNLTPANPTFIQARDAILQADRVSYGGTNQNELWLAFAKRGMGFSATCPASTTTIGVQEAFDLPDDLVITPTLPMVASGPNGGPFSPNTFIYSLANRSANALSWALLNTNSWLSFSNSSGVLAPNTSAYYVTGYIHSSASSLSDGVYSGNLLFANLSSQSSQTRPVTLSVGQPDYFTELFESSDNDVQNQSILFVPNGLGSYYAACRATVNSFPVDPTLGKRLTLPDDGFIQVTLSGNGKVCLYGKETNTFFIASNGYLSLDSGDSSYSGTLPIHFAVPRISGLFADLNPEAGGRISWQQLGDRTVVTYENIPEYSSGKPNSFQFELFYDGRIRLTHLNIGAKNVLIGLSAGKGKPPAFVESDLTSYPSCSMQLVLTMPTNSMEGAGILNGAGVVTLPGPVNSPLTVSLRSSNPSEVQVPPSLVIPTGASAGAFNIQIVDDAELDGTQNSLITVAAAGYFGSTASISVSDNESTTLGLVLPGQASEGAQPVIGTLQVPSPPGAAVQVNLASSAPTRLQVPSKVFLPKGASSVAFEMLPLDNDKIDGSKTVQITAQVPNWTSATGLVTILDNETNALKVTVPAQVSEASGLVNARVSLSGTVSSNQTIFLESSEPSVFDVPTSIIIPAGSREATFQLVVFDNPAVEENRNVTLTVAAPGWFGMDKTLQVLDDDTPPQPFRPQPPHQSGDIPVSTRLSWHGGDGELFINGDFETGTFAGWTLENTGTGGFVVNDGSLDPESPDGPLPPYAGNFSALSNPSGVGRHGLYQDVFIPPGASTVTLRWAQRIHNHAPAFGSNQQFRVEIRDQSNAVLRVAYAPMPGEPLLGNWTTQQSDLSDFRGASIRIAFVEEDSTSFLNAHVDNVSLIADSPTPLTYEVYLGTSPDSGGQLLGTTTNTFWDLQPLAPLTTYFWRIISQGIGENPSPLWNFTTRGVDHFSWASLGATQRVGQPFPVRLTAYDEAGSVISNFHGTVMLEGWSMDEEGIISMPIQVLPANAAYFTNGTWSGQMTIMEPASRMILIGSDNQGHAGASEIISAVENNDLSVSIVASPSPVITGTEVIYTISVYNSGPLAANGVMLSASLPASASLNALDPSQGSCTIVGQDLSCDVGDLAPDTSLILKLFMNSGPEGTLSISATANRSGFDPITWNNVASITTDVIPIRFVSVLGTSVNEDAGSARFTVQLDAPLPVPVAVAFGTADGAATGGSDYVPTNGVVVIPPGATNATVSIKVLNDNANEPVESFYLNLFEVSNALPDVGFAEASIQDDDPEPTLLAQDGSVRAPSLGQTNILIPIALSKVSGHTVTVDFNTLNITALSGADYAATNGTIVFAPGETNIVLSIPVFSSFPEPTNRYFQVHLSNATHAEIARPDATGKIIGRNHRPSLSLSNVAILEGPSGATEAVFTATLSFPAISNVTANFSAQPGTALATIDYGTTSGTLLFAPGEISKTIRVPINGDTLDEDDETFSVLLSGITHAIPGITNAIGTIINDDPHPPLFIANASVNSASAMNTEVLLPLRLGATSGRSVTVAFQTRNGSAIAGTDYMATNGIIQFPPGTTNALLRLTILKERAGEPDETFYVDLDSPDNALLATATATVTITHIADANGTVNYFDWTNIPSPQFSNHPIAITLSARDAQGEVVPTFSAPVTLRAEISEPAAETPAGTAPAIFPLGSFYHDSRSQLLYPAWEIGSAKQFVALGFEVANSGGQILSNCTVRIKHTLSSSNTSWQTEGWQMVFQGTMRIDGPGWVTFPFLNPFDFNGTNHLLIDFSFDNGSAGIDGQCRSRDTGSPRSLFYRSDSAHGNPLSWNGAYPQGNLSTFVPNLRLLPPPVSLPVSPSWANQWNNGVFTGPVRIPATGTNIQLVAEDESGRIGRSNPFELLSPGSTGSSPVLYLPPLGGWTYLYAGDADEGGAKGAAVLDGTWDHNNPSSAWDGLGRGLAHGAPGGISTDTYALTLEDAISATSGAANNRSLFFTRGLHDPAVTNAQRILDDGVTLSFRARLTPSSIYPAADMSLPNGYGISDGGKGNLGIRQGGGLGAAPGLISFSLVQPSEDLGGSNGFALGRSGLTMNRLNGNKPTNDVDSASRARLEPLWNLPAGSRAYLTSGNTERNIAYNPVTDHLLLVSRAAAVGGLQIPILNASTGAEVGKLPTNGVSGGSAVLNGIGVAEDGAIYAANVVSFNNSSSSAFRIYRWAYESASPTIAFSGEILNGHRWGDTLDVRGSGLGTQILVGSGSSTNKVAIFTTTNGIHFTPALLDSVGPATNGDFRTALAFGPGNTFFARQLSGPLLQMSFDLVNNTANWVRSFDSSVFPASITSLSIETTSSLLAGVSPALTSTNAALVELYDLDVLSTNRLNPSLDVERLVVANANPQAVCSVQIGGGRVFALDANNGLLACSLKLLPGTNNLLPLDPTVFHEFWVTIKGNTPNNGPGTHTVSVYVDGSMSPNVFQVTAGTGFDLSATSPASSNFTTALSTNYLALGCPSSAGTGAIDVDFFGYRPGVHQPRIGNQAPTLTAIADRTVYAGSSLWITNQASDPNLPNDMLSFSMDAAPPGAAIGISSGVFSWTAPETQSPSTNLVIIRVSDSGIPPLSDTRSFRVFIVARPKANAVKLGNGNVQLSWVSVSGQLYRLQYKNDLNEMNWQNLTGTLTGTGSMLTITDPSPVAAQRFYRIQILQ